MVGDRAGKPSGAVGFLHRTSTLDNKSITFCMQKKQSNKRRERKEAVRCAFCLTRKEVKHNEKQKVKLNKSARKKTKTKHIVWSPFLEVEAAFSRVVAFP